MLSILKGRKMTGLLLCKKVSLLKCLWCSVQSISFVSWLLTLPSPFQIFRNAIFYNSKRVEPWNLVVWNMFISKLLSNLKRACFFFVAWGVRGWFLVIIYVFITESIFYGCWKVFYSTKSSISLYILLTFRTPKKLTDWWTQLLVPDWRPSPEGFSRVRRP